MDPKKYLTDCHFFTLGNCNKVESCEFRHVHGRGSGETTKICKFWRKETCENVECTFRHPTLPRSPDGSLIMCLYEQHGGCAKRDTCPYAHKFEAGSSIPGLSTDDQPLGRLTITLAPPSSDPRIVPKATPATANGSSTSTPTSSTPTSPQSSQSQTSTPAGEGTEPPSKRLRPQGSGPRIISLASKKTEDNGGAQPSQEKDASKPQAMSFVKSFHEILKQREQETKGVPSQEQETKEKGKQKEQQPQQQQQGGITSRLAKPAQEQGAGRGKKRKVAETAPKKAPPAKNTKVAPNTTATSTAATNASKATKGRKNNNNAQDAKTGEKSSILARLSRPGAKVAAKPAPASSAESKAPVSFGIKSLGELMKEKGPQGEAADPAASAAATVAAQATKKATPSVGTKRKLEQVITTTTRPQQMTPPQQPQQPQQPPQQRQQQATTVTTGQEEEEENLEDLEKELEELVGDMPEEEMEGDIDVDVDLGL